MKDRNRRRAGFTIVEMVIVMVIMTVILSALGMVLGVGERASGIGTAKVDIQSEVRTLINWIAQDVRQAKIQELHDNSPTRDYIKFNLWEWSNGTFNQTYTDQYVEYEYDSVTQNISRRFIEDDEVMYEHNYTNITMSPFYTSYTDEATNDFDNQTLLSGRSLIVVIKKQKTVRNTVLNFTMVEEVRIRNE